MRIDCWLIPGLMLGFTWSRALDEEHRSLYLMLFVICVCGGRK